VQVQASEGQGGRVGLTVLSHDHPGRVQLDHRNAGGPGSGAWGG
jgi:hypothetical protein